MQHAFLYTLRRVCVMRKVIRVLLIVQLYTGAMLLSSAVSVAQFVTNSIQFPTSGGNANLLPPTSVPSNVTLRLPPESGTLLVSSGSSLTMGNATNAGTFVLQDGDGEKGTLGVTDLSADRTYTFPDVSGIIAVIAGSALGVGDATNAGSIVLQDGSGQSLTLVSTNLTANRTFTFPDVSGTVLVSDGGALSVGDASTAGTFVLYDGNGQNGTLGVTDLRVDRTYTFPDTSGTVAIIAGSALGVGSATSAGSVVLQDGSGQSLTLISTNLTADRTFTFPDVSGTVMVTNGTAITTGTTGSAGSLVIHDGSGQTGTLITANLTADRTYTFPDDSGTLAIVPSTAAGVMQYGTTSTQQSIHADGTTYLFDVAYSGTPTGDALGARIASNSSGLSNQDATALAVSTQSAGNGNAKGLVVSAVGASAGTANGIEISATGGGVNNALHITAGDLRSDGRIVLGRTDVSPAVGGTVNVTSAYMHITLPNTTGGGGITLAPGYDGQVVFLRITKAGSLGLSLISLNTNGNALLSISLLTEVNRIMQLIYIEAENEWFPVSNITLL